MSAARVKTGGRRPAAEGIGVRHNISGARIRAARQASQPKLTLEELAARVRDLGLALDASALSKIERGLREVRDFELKSVAEALNRPIKWLVDEKDTV